MTVRSSTICIVPEVLTIRQYKEVKKCKKIKEAKILCSGNMIEWRKKSKGVHKLLLIREDNNVLGCKTSFQKLIAFQYTSRN